jgi:hypothetical protein
LSTSYISTVKVKDSVSHILNLVDRVSLGFAALFIIHKILVNLVILLIYEGWGLIHVNYFFLHI